MSSYRVDGGSLGTPVLLEEHPSLANDLPCLARRVYFEAEQG